MRSLTVRYNLLSEELASDIAEHADTAGKSSLSPPPLSLLLFQSIREKRVVQRCCSYQEEC